MTNLPPELQQFAAFLDAQPANVRKNFQYCLALLMIEAGKAELVETVAGDVFAIPKPAISPKNEAILLERLRDILDE